MPIWNNFAIRGVSNDAEVPEIRGFDQVRLAGPARHVNLVKMRLCRQFGGGAISKVPLLTHGIWRKIMGNGGRVQSLHSFSAAASKAMNPSRNSNLKSLPSRFWRIPVTMPHTARIRYRTPKTIRCVMAAMLSGSPGRTQGYRPGTLYRKGGITGADRIERAGQLFLCFTSSLVSA